jgi:hypothetical protein
MKDVANNEIEDTDLIAINFCHISINFVLMYADIYRDFLNLILL